jgi:hypothetical protein
MILIKDEFGEYSAAFDDIVTAMYLQITSDMTCDLGRWIARLIYVISKELIEAQRTGYHHHAYAAVWYRDVKQFVEMADLLTAD